VVEAHLGLARRVASRFAKRNPPPEDLVQVSSIALLKAVDRFDPHRGVDFVTYANYTMTGELKRHLRDEGWAVRPPRRVQELSLNLGPAISRLAQVHGRSPTVAELAGELHVSDTEVAEALQAGRARRSGTLDGTREEDDTTALAECLGDDDLDPQQLEARCMLQPAIGQLPEREQTILYLRFFEEKTQADIAVHVGISQNHVSRLLRQCLTQLRSSPQVEDLG
jgi:RNA polymerase sigma-B factor